MRVGSLQRQRKSSILPVIGGCLAVYAVCAVGFHALVEPSLGKNQPPPAPVLQYSAAALAARAEAVMPPVAANRPAPAGAAARPTASKVNAKVAPAADPGADRGPGPGSGADPSRSRDSGAGAGSNAGRGTVSGPGSDSGRPQQRRH